MTGCQSLAIEEALSVLVHVVPGSVVQFSCTLAVRPDDCWMFWYAAIYVITKLVKSTSITGPRPKAMIPEPYELFDFDRGSDKMFLIGTTWIVLFLFLL